VLPVSCRRKPGCFTRRGAGYERRVSSLTVKQLSVRLGVPPRRLVELMAQDAERGVVEQDVDGRWRLTAGAERAFGTSLRNLMAPSTLAGVRRSRGPYSEAGPHGILDGYEAPGAMRQRSPGREAGRRARRDQPSRTHLRSA
jgi:hypothetical protein